MNDAGTGRFPDLEKQINDSLKEVALELRSVDVIDLASYIHTLKLGNVGDLINSALELYFKPQTFVFSYSGDVELTWFGSPSVSLDMELHCAGVDVYFSLTIEALTVGVHIKRLFIDGVICDKCCDSIRFSKALETARFPIAPNALNVWKPRSGMAGLPQ
jgi:hypothetical protein